MGAKESQERKRRQRSGRNPQQLVWMCQRWKRGKRGWDGMGWDGSTRSDNQAGQGSKVVLLGGGALLQARRDEAQRDDAMAMRFGAR